MQARRLRVAVALCAMLILLGLAGATSLLLARLRATAEANAVETVERIVRIAESALNRQFLSVDGALAGLQPILGIMLRDGMPDTPLEPMVASQMLRELNYQNLNFRDLTLLQPDGQRWASALTAARRRQPPIEPAALAEAQRSGSVVVSGPVRNALTGEWALFFLRGVRLDGVGAFIAAAEVPVALVTTLLRPILERPGLRIAVETTSGRLLASLPHDEGWIGQSQPPRAPHLKPDGQAVEIPGRDPRTTVFAAMRPTLYRDISVLAGYDAEAALATWYQDRRRLLLGAAATALLITALALALDAALRQRERSETERAAARRLLESAIETMPDGFVMWDADDRLVVCNQRYRDLYPITAPSIRPGARFADIIRYGAHLGQYPEVGADIEAFVDELVQWHRGDKPSVERLLADGRWVLATERRIPQGGTVGIRTDITALKRANADLSAARDAAAATTLAKTRFLARMSHELRTPLNGVLGLAQVLARDPALSGEQRDRARTLEKAGRHAVAVANDVLDLAKLESGRFALRDEATALPALLQDCVALVSSAAADKAIALRLSVDRAVPARVAIDQTRLRQLLLNLLSNALKFTPTGGRVDLAAEPRGSVLPDGWVVVRLEVRDTGPGVPAAMRQAIFGDFVQLDRGQDGGSGLGLAIATGIVEQMGGRIGCLDHAAPEGRGGAVFWVEMPMRPLAEAAEEPSRHEPAEPRAGLRVLVADDVAANLAVARALLESAGYVVACVAGGAQAVAAVAEAAAAAQVFDVVLMDVMMPGVDGLEAARRIRALPGPERAVPMLAVTASVFAEDIAACDAAGMDAHLAKPIERGALLAALARLTERPGGAAGDTPPELPLLAGTGRPALVVPGLDAASTARLAVEFLREISEAAESLRTATSAEPMIAAAHRLAGAAATLGATRLAAAARALQSNARGLAEPALQRDRASLLDIAAQTVAALAADPAIGAAA